MDEWEMRGGWVVARVRNVPTSSWFSPIEVSNIDPCSVELDYLEVHREAKTHGDEHLFGKPQNYKSTWIGKGGYDCKPFLRDWRGETISYKRLSPTPPEYYFFGYRLTR